MKEDADFLVVGSGIAGLIFALEVAEHGRVLMMTKGQLLDSNTDWAQGGIASVMDFENDSFEAHVADTLDAGAGLCDESAVRGIIERGPEVIRLLSKYGVHFDLDGDGDYNLGQEGGHTARRILHSKDTTGHEIASKLVAAAKAHPNIEIWEHHYVIDLVTTEKLGIVTEDRVLGVYVLDVKAGQVKRVRCDRVMLATGGCGKVYLYTTNPDSATGDGLAMAWRAGAVIGNMEFIQFHPTCFYNPAAEGAKARSFLISEAVRGEGGILVDDQGYEFMQDYDSRGSLAPRDIVARAIDHHLKRTGAACAYVDISHRPADYIRERFPLIYETCLKYGIDATKQPIPVVPAAHYQCGGIVTDLNGQSTLRGLFVAGEAGCTGLHGANRLASNSLLEGAVIALNAAKAILIKLPLGHEPQAYEIPKWQKGDATEVDERVIIYHNWDEIRRLMWDYVSIVRTDKRLQRAATRLRNLKREVREFYWGHLVTPEILELRNLVTVASLIVDSASRRKESRGLHYTLDYPEASEHFRRQSTRIRRS